MSGLCLPQRDCRAPQAQPVLRVRLGLKGLKDLQERRGPRVRKVLKEMKGMPAPQVRRVRRGRRVKRGCPVRRAGRLDPRENRGRPGLRGRIPYNWRFSSGVPIL